MTSRDHFLVALFVGGVGLLVIGSGENALIPRIVGVIFLTLWTAGMTRLC